MKRFVLCSLVAAALALLCAANSFAGGPYNPACNCVPKDKDVVNPLKISVDTCGLSAITTRNCDSLPYYSYQLRQERRLYTKIWNGLTFKFNDIMSNYSTDTVFDAPWTIIDPQFPILREEFRRFDSIVGGFSFRRASEGSLLFFLIFDNYVNGMDVFDLIPKKIWEYAEGKFDENFRHPSSAEEYDPARTTYIFPQPAKETITCALSNGVHQVTLYSLLGEVVYAGEITTVNNSITIDVRKLSNGVYFLRVNRFAVIPIFMER